MTARFEIDLTPEEQEICDAIEFDVLKLRGKAERNGELVASLTHRLVARGAIPEQRILYFTDPEYNRGNHGKSRKQIFERNGCVGDDILRHPHFLKYLRYFLCGSSLPARVIAAYVRSVEDCGMVTSGDLSTLSSEARRLTRLHRLESSSASDEFFKLAIDCGISSWMADSIRQSVRSVRLR